MNAIEKAIQGEMDAAKECGRAAAALAPFVDVPNVAYATAGKDWSEFPASNLIVRLRVEKGVKPRGTVTAAMRAVGAQRADKVFDQETGEVKYVIKTGTTTKVEVVAGAPETCEVEVVEEEVEIPAREASTEIRKVYRLKDPKCLEGRSRKAEAEVQVETPDTVSVTVPA